MYYSYLLLLFNPLGLASLQFSAAMDASLEFINEAQAVCLDVDSTLICHEGIDLLARACGVELQVQELTHRAMNGNVLFQSALRDRLDIIQPSLEQVLDVSVQIQSSVNAGVVQFVEALHARGKDVYLVSGGFTRMIQPLADLLNIPSSRVYANVLLFNQEGKYIGYDETQPTSRSLGKQVVAAKLKQVYDKLIFIGDGVTDLEAKPPADVFIGYGGVVERQQVQDKADAYIYHFDTLINVLK